MLRILIDQFMWFSVVCFAPVNRLDIAPNAFGYLATFNMTMNMARNQERFLGYTNSVGCSAGLANTLSRDIVVDAEGFASQIKLVSIVVFITIMATIIIKYYRTRTVYKVCTYAYCTYSIKAKEIYINCNE